MQRNDLKTEKRARGYCKIRKRVSSSSSSSSLVKNYRLKRAILVGKKMGSSTPVPTWKKTPSGSPVIMQNLEGLKCNFKGKESMSARKLGASLWEINGVRSPGERGEEFVEKKGRGRKISSGSDRIGMDHSLTPSPLCEKMEGSKAGGHRRRSSEASKRLHITEYDAARGLHSVGNVSSMEVRSLAPVENIVSINTRMKDVSDSLRASKELIKVLFKMLAEDERHSSKLTLVSALRVELNRAKLQVDQLVQEETYNTNEINTILKQFAAEKSAWKSKEREKIREAVSSVTRELEIERKLRRQAERMNKKLGTELADTRHHLSSLMKELDSERRAREIIEQTCDELARGIGEERVEVEELKRESAKVRDEVEMERKMMQLADVIREERVQMKLAEAKYEYEEKNEALEKLRKELERYIRDGIGEENGDGCHQNKEFCDVLRKIQVGFCRNEEREGDGEDGVDDRGEDSEDSELHSIELNMENNNIGSSKWSLIRDGMNNGDSKRASVDEMFKGRRSISEKIQWENICLHKSASDGIVLGNNTGNTIEFDKERLSSTNAYTDKGQSSAQDSHQNGESKDSEDEMKRYKATKSQKLASCQGSPSLTVDSSKSSSRLREACSAILQDLALRSELF